MFSRPTAANDGLHVVGRAALRSADVGILAEAGSATIAHTVVDFSAETIVELFVVLDLDSVSSVLLGEILVDDI